MNANQPSLFALPLEILTSIFGLLEGRQIARCDAVWTPSRNLAIFDCKRVECIQDPHPPRGIPFRRWTLGDFALPIQQIEIDPGNNLLVVLSAQVPLLIGRESPYPNPTGTVALHLRTLSDNSPHRRAIGHILTSICIKPWDQMLRIMGHLLGVTTRSRCETRLEIWDWMAGQKMTREVLEAYQILIENPGAPPVHTASFCLPRPNFDQYYPTVHITGNPPLSQRIDHGNLSDCSPSPSPCFHWLEAIIILPLAGVSTGLLLCPCRGLGSNSMFLCLRFVALPCMKTLWRYPGKHGQRISISTMTVEENAG
ncbi:hypothetical protein BS47DRAFT_1378746 [Hydnum rufescens UP504]|uniref:F-box domain-containing protein n=1 Tax=Hydnum rufescens UP504 TaxID=1448309 RepID=A0A9P6BAR5_9AGAM|nr:hypothetical protein BS47DRAFT_1378746 [Hydnum rufescens UP504]